MTAGGSRLIHLCRFVMDWNHMRIQSVFNGCLPPMDPSCFMCWIPVSRTINEHRRSFCCLYYRHDCLPSLMGVFIKKSIFSLAVTPQPEPPPSRKGKSLTSIQVCHYFTMHAVVELFWRLMLKTQAPVKPKRMGGGWKMGTVSLIFPDWLSS